MIRVLLAASLLAVVPPMCQAEGTVVALKVRPMAAPKPAFKYQLLPEVREMHPGNPAQWYFRCFAEQRNFFFSQGGVALRKRYLTLPLTELRKEKVREYGGNALRQADWAARLDALDWQVLERVQTQGMDLTLPELEPLNILALSLRARFRVQLAGEQYDEAIGTAKTLFALARHLGECPVEAANRLGLTVARLGLDALEEMFQQPGCPNLYWALSDLPHPLVDLRKGFQGQQTRVATELRPLRNDLSLSEEELEKVVGRLSGIVGFAREQSGQPPRSFRVTLRARVHDAERVRAARARLVDAGSSAKQIPSFSPLQIILLDEAREYEIRRDERKKLLAMPLAQIESRDEEALARPGETLLADLLPDILPAHCEQGRLQQRIALLRHVEALRLYAAAHEGKWPDKLSACPVPLPEDPFTGKPFRYQREGATVRLFAGPAASDEPKRHRELRYEVTLQR